MVLLKKSKEKKHTFLCNILFFFKGMPLNFIIIFYSTKRIERKRLPNCSTEVVIYCLHSVFTQITSTLNSTFIPPSAHPHYCYVKSVAKGLSTPLTYRIKGCVKKKKRVIYWFKISHHASMSARSDAFLALSFSSLRFTSQNRVSPCQNL